MGRRPKGAGGDTPEAARTDSNVTRLPVPGRGGDRTAEDRPPAAPQESFLSDDDLTADALRHALDHGKGGDKVDFADPAAAPLGTDDEAAGFPPTRAQRAEAARQELGAHRTAEEAQTDHTAPRRAQGGTMPPLWVVLILLLVVVLGVSLLVDGV